MTLHDLTNGNYTLGDVIELCQDNDISNGNHHFVWSQRHGLALCRNQAEGGDFLYCMEQLIAADFDVDSQNTYGIARLCPHTPTHPEIR